MLWSSIGEGIGLFLVNQLLINLGHSDLIVSAMALVVGLHFIPIAYWAPFHQLGGSNHTWRDRRAVDRPTSRRNGIGIHGCRCLGRGVNRGGPPRTIGEIAIAAPTEELGVWQLIKIGGAKPPDGNPPFCASWDGVAAIGPPNWTGWSWAGKRSGWNRPLAADPLPVQPPRSGRVRTGVCGGSSAFSRSSRRP